VPLLLRAPQRPLREGDRVVRRVVVDLHGDLAREHGELLPGGRAADVGRDDERVRPCEASRRASFATVVVLPEPCSPATRIRRTPWPVQVERDRCAPSSACISSRSTFTTIATGSGSRGPSPGAPAPRPSGGGRGRPSLDVRLQQRHPHLPQGPLHVSGAARPRAQAAKTADSLSVRFSNMDGRAAGPARIRRGELVPELLLLRAEVAERLRHLRLDLDGDPLDDLEGRSRGSRRNFCGLFVR